MIALTLSNLPSQLQHEFIMTMLKPEDAIILTSSSISLVYHHCQYQAQPFVRKTDLTMAGGTPHPDWQIISDKQWCEILLSATKNVNW